MQVNFKSAIQRIDKTIFDEQQREIAHIKAEFATKQSYCRTKFPYFYATENGEFSTLAKPHVHISDLYVKPECRGQGLGKKLIRYAVEKSRELGGEGRVILLAGSNEASPLPFYKKLGFLSVTPRINRLIDEAIKWQNNLDRTLQTFMYLPQKRISKFLKRMTKI